MKQLTLKLVIPLTFISFVVYTKWWYTLPVDAPDTMFYGFPLIYYGDGWASSMTTQIFLLEFFVDLLVYFTFWFVLVFLIRKIKGKIRIPKGVAIFNFAMVFAFVLSTFLSLFSMDNHFRFKRYFDVEVMDSGNKFMWQHIDQPDYYKYHPEKKH